MIPGYLPDVVDEADGLRVMSLAEALCRVPVSYSRLIHQSRGCAALGA